VFIINNFKPKTTCQRGDKSEDIFLDKQNLKGNKSMRDNWDFRDNKDNRDDRDFSDMEEIIPTNKFQTKITRELLDTLPKEVEEDLIGYINNVPFIQNLISPKRKYAKDCPRDETGRIIVNLSNPHILEDMDFFRPAALHFKEHGVYTKLKINTSSRSEYMRWFRQELDRCWNGMIREEDGEWITGDMYFYLNYTIMKKIVIVTLKNGKELETKSDDLPEM